MVPSLSRWLCLALLVCLLIVGCQGREEERKAPVGRIGLCEGGEGEEAWVRVADVIATDANVPEVFLSPTQRLHVSPYDCHTAAFFHLLSADGTDGEAAFAVLSLAEDVHGSNEESDEDVICDGELCEAKGGRGEAGEEECSEDIAISAALANELQAKEGDILLVSHRTVRSHTEYRTTGKKTRGKEQRKAVVVPMHPTETYEMAENIYCQAVPKDIQRLSQSTKLVGERQPPVAAQVAGLIPSSYKQEVILHYTQTRCLDLPVPYPFLTISSADQKKTVTDVRVRLHGSPPYAMSQALTDLYGSLYLEEAELWLADRNTRGMHRPLYETQDGLPDDGILLTEAVAKRLGAQVGDFVIIAGTLTHEAYAYRKEIEQLKRKLAAGDL